MSELKVSEFPVEKEFKKNPQISEEDIKKFRDWIKGQPHLPADQISDLELLLMFHSCMQSTEVAKQVLDLNCTLRTNYSFLSDGNVDDRVKSALDAVLFAPLPQATAEGYRILLVKLLDPDPRKFTWWEVSRAFTLVIDLWQRAEGTWPGILIVVDLEHAVIGHLGRFDPTVVQQVTHYLQEAMPVRLKGFHFINAPSFIDKLMMLIRPFLKKELQDMMRIHPVGASSVKEIIDKSAFPKDMGGEYKSTKELKEETWLRLQANKDWIKQLSLTKVNEGLRTGGKAAAPVYGMTGSFKKLDID